MPEYIKEEIEKYIEEKKNGRLRFTTYENIIAFVRLAVVNGRITEEEARQIRAALFSSDRNSPFWRNIKKTLSLF